MDRKIACKFSVSFLIVLIVSIFDQTSLTHVIRRGRRREQIGKDRNYSQDTALH